MVERSFETAVWHPFFKMFVSLIRRYYNAVNLTFFTILYTSWYKRCSRWSPGTGSAEMPAHWHPAPAKQILFRQKSKWICPSRELLLIWHTGQKWYSLDVISGHHMRLPVARSVGPVPLRALKGMKGLREITEVKHMEYLPFYLVCLSGRLQGWHTKTKLKNPALEISGIFAISLHCCQQPAPVLRRTEGSDPQHPQPNTLHHGRIHGLFCFFNTSLQKSETDELAQIAGRG